jgi:hypothetical protein
VFLLPFGATVVASFFTVNTWRAAMWSQSRALATWSFALAQFAVASAALTWGVAFGWSSSLYRVFYLFGAIVNVAWLGLGTVRLLVPDTAWRWLVTLGVIALSIYAAVVVVGATFVPGAAHALASERIPVPSHVMPGGVRALSRWSSIGGSLVVVGGLVWSIAKRRRVVGFALLAGGVVVVGVAGELARAGLVAGFSACLAAGIATMYAGFLRTQG